MSRNYKQVKHTGTVHGCISDGVSALVSLGEECREIVDNAPEGLNQTSRIETFDETAGTLENMSEPEIPDCIGDAPLDYYESVPTRKGRSASRSTQCSNAVAMITAGKEAIEAQMAKWEEEKSAEASEDEKAGLQDKIDEARSCVDDLDNIISEAEGVEFPGMFG